MDYASMWAYLWDLLDEGVESSLAAMRDEAGVDSVSVATAYHSVQHLRPAAPGHRFFTARESALYFPPDRPRYPTAAFQPRVSPLVVGGNPLREVSDRCANQEIRLISWTVMLHSSLGLNYPDLAVRNVFGDTISEALCPAQEPVRAYACALVDDLTANYRIAAVEVESLAYPAARHYHGHAKIGIALGPLEEFLLSLCFCPACRSRLGEGTDVEAAAAAVQATLEEVFRAGEATGQPVEEYLRSHPAVESYVLARREVVTSLVREVKSACRAELVYMDMGPWWGTGADLPAISRIADRVELLCYQRDAAAIRAAVARVAGSVGPEGRVTAGLCAYAPASPDADALRESVTAALEGGASALSFYHYGIMPRRNLAWVRRALLRTP